MWPDIKKGRTDEQLFIHCCGLNHSFVCVIFKAIING